MSHCRCKCEPGERSSDHAPLSKVMAESDPIDPKVKKSFSRVIAGVHETLCEKLDLKRVGEQLTTGTRLKKTLRGLVRRAVKDKDVEFFFSILSQKFNLKSLVFFLEVLDSTAAENHDHKEILTILCHNLEELPVEDEPSEVVKQLKKITSRYVGISAMVEELSVEDESSGVVTILENMPGISADAPIVVLYHEYEVETFSFSKSKSHVQHSSTHDVTVYVEPVAFPEDLDRFNVSLTVNNYAQPITMPPQFTAVYSVLINLKCEPPFEKFEDYVTVTLPHCAVGDIDSLCVLSAPDGDYNLVEDLDIEIVSIDEAYVTFRTRHFSNNTVSASKRRKQKILKLKQRAAFLRAASLDETARRMSHKARPIRSYSSPAVFENEPDMQFCVLMCRPCDTSSASHWQFVFIVITDEITLTEVSCLIVRVPRENLSTWHAIGTFLLACSVAACSLIVCRDLLGTGTKPLADCSLYLPGLHGLNKWVHCKNKLVNVTTLVVTFTSFLQ